MLWEVGLENSAPNGGLSPSLSSKKMVKTENITMTDRRVEGLSSAQIEGIFVYQLHFLELES